MPWRKLAVYTAVGAIATGFGVALMPSQDEKARKVLEASGQSYGAYTAEARKRQDAFSNVLIASMTSDKTIYGAKDAEKYRLYERAQMIGEMKKEVKVPHNLFGEKD